MNKTISNIPEIVPTNLDSICGEIWLLIAITSNSAKREEFRWQWWRWRTV